MKRIISIILTTILLSAALPTLAGAEGIDNAPLTPKWVPDSEVELISAGRQPLCGGGLCRLLWPGAKLAQWLLGLSLPASGMGEATTPAWAKELIMMEFRIEAATPEGTFQAGVKVLGHIAEMGVNGIWCPPFYEKGPGQPDDPAAATATAAMGPTPSTGA